MRSGAFLAILLAVIFGAMAILVLNDGGPIAGLEDHQFAQLVKLAAWGSVLAAGIVFMGRMRAGSLLKSAAIWALAFLLVIGAYAYSSEFEHLKNRMLAALVPGTVISLTEGERGRVMVMRGFDNHFHVDATINGVEVPLLVDTGASIVAIDRETASRIGIDVEDLNFYARVRTANGIAAAAPVTLDYVRVGDIERRDVDAVVAEGEGIGIDLLGMSFLGTLSSVDFRGDRLVLTE